MSQAESSGWLNQLIEFRLAQSRDLASQLTASWVMATLVLGVGICWYICLALLSPFQGCWALHQLVPYSWYLDISGQSYWLFGPKYVHANCCEGPHFLGRIGRLLVSGRQPICQCGVLRYTPREWRFFQRGSSWCEFAGSGHNRSSIWLWNLPLWFDPHQRHQVPFWWGNCYPGLHFLAFLLDFPLLQGFQDLPSSRVSPRVSSMVSSMVSSRIASTSRSSAVSSIWLWTLSFIAQTSLKILLNAVPDSPCWCSNSREYCRSGGSSDGACESCGCSNLSHCSHKGCRLLVGGDSWFVEMGG